MARELPIIFTGDMVRAILDGRKTQTRRPVKQFTTDITQVCDDGTGGFIGWQPGVREERVEFTRRNYPNEGVRPAYSLGYRLYVRENYAARLDQDHMNAAQLYAAGVRGVGYWADGPAKCCNTGCAGGAGKVRPSIHMPKWAARIWLRVTEVRCVRVADISEDDARAEGVTPVAFCRAGVPDGNEHREAFGMAWKALYGDESWARNDWAFAYTFVREEVRHGA